MFDLYDNPYSCNVKDELDDDQKQQTNRKRKYNKTGKYKKTVPDQQDNAENSGISVCIFIFHRNVFLRISKISYFS